MDAAEASLELTALREFVRERPESLEVLSERERIIVVSRLSDAPHQRRTFADLGVEFNWTHVRVRVALKLALDKLRVFKDRDLQKCVHCNGRGWIGRGKP